MKFTQNQLISPRSLGFSLCKLGNPERWLHKVILPHCSTAIKALLKTISDPARKWAWLICPSHLARPCQRFVVASVHTQTPAAQCSPVCRHYASRAMELASSLSEEHGHFRDQLAALCDHAMLACAYLMLTGEFPPDQHQLKAASQWCHHMNKMFCSSIITSENSESCSCLARCRV